MKQILTVLAGLFLLPQIAFAGPVLYRGGIVRGDVSKKAVSFVFTGGYYGEGADHILNVLAEKKAPGNFFLTGNYLRNKQFAEGVRRMIREGHYVGAHSNNHPKYVSSASSKKTLISKGTFVADLDRNFGELAKFGVKKKEARYFIPPYEMYNETISKWAREYGLILFNRTLGTRTHGDYTDPTMKNYYSSDTIMRFVWAEEVKKNGLNGHLMLIHLGVGTKRKDKFYHRLGELIDGLRAKGYAIVSVPDLLGEKEP